MGVQVDQQAARTAVSRRPSGLTILTVLLIAMVLAQRWIVELFRGHPAAQTFGTVFVAICLQALPFLVLGVVLSGCITAFVPTAFWTKALPRNRALAVPVAAGAGMAPPGCECASVPIAGGLVVRGVTPAAALAFLLSAPAINPVVLVATSVAFPGRPEVVLARFAAALATAVLVGWAWARFGRETWMRVPRRPSTEGLDRAETFRATMTHDFLQSGGYLVVGAATAGGLNVLVPRTWLGAVAAHPAWSVLFLAGLAVVLAICSEADAFVAASLTEFSLMARLAFMVVGPVVDVKLIAMQAGTFGRRFSTRFAPLTFAVAVTSAVLVGACLL